MPIIQSMASPQYIGKTSTSSVTETSQQRDAWLLVGLVGIVFVVLGFTDIALGLYPLAFGNSEWEFGMVSAILNGFAIPTMGFYLFLASLVARGRSAGARITAVLMIVVAVALTVLALFYAMAIPLALRSVSGNALVALGMKKALVKAGVLFVGYLGLYSFGALKGWRCGSAR